MIEEVLQVMQQAAEVAILPRLRTLRSDEVEEKSPGELVTLADREAETIIADALRRIRPDAVVIGEEAAAFDPKLVDALGSSSAVWLLDPLDGTANFVAGLDDFAVMVALLEQGQTTHAWIWQPVAKESWVAVRGAGAERNGVVVHAGSSQSPGSMKGAVLTRFLSPAHREAISTAGPLLGDILPGKLCAGIEYPDIATGLQDFALFRRTLPWDHAPGAFILQEAGGVARRWDGQDYSPSQDGEGLLAATDEDAWRHVAKALLPTLER